MKSYLLLLRDNDRRWDRFSPEDLRRVLDLFAAWNAKLREAEQFEAAGKLKTDPGLTIRSGGAGPVVDGPYSEAKEAIVGYYRIRAADREAAIAAAKDCPILTYGGTVELREMAG